MTDAPNPSAKTGEFEARALMLVQKHGNPVGTDYEQGQNDMGHRMVTLARDADAAILSALTHLQPLAVGLDREAVEPYAWALVNAHNDIIQRRDQMHADYNLLTDEDLISEGWEPLYATPAQPDTGDVAALREAIMAVIDANKYEAWTVDRCGQMADAILALAAPDHSEVRTTIVKTIAFLKRDLDTDRINNTVESLLPDLVKADAILRGVKP